MGEQRRYTAFDLGRARERLRAELPTLAARGLRPSWMVWLPRRPRWLPLRRGELVVQFEPVAGTRPGAGLPRILNPLLYGLREVIGLQREAIDTLEALTSETSTPRATDATRLARRAELERRCRRLERTTREIELELKRIEGWLER